MMYREPSDSPWGLVVRCDTLCPGVYSVSTAGHGGIMAQIDAARQLLSPEAQAVGFQDRRVSRILRRTAMRRWSCGN